MVDVHHLADVLESYHLVKGDRGCGFIVHKGASSGVIGTDAVIEYRQRE